MNVFELEYRMSPNSGYQVHAITPHGTYEFEIIDVLVDHEQKVVRLKLEEISRRADMQVLGGFPE